MRFGGGWGDNVRLASGRNCSTVPPNWAQQVSKVSLEFSYVGMDV